MIFLKTFCSYAMLFGGLLGQARNLNPLDRFLDSLNINPLSIPAAAKAQNGTTLACAILDALSTQKTVLQSTGTDAYTVEREAHWSATAWEYPTCIFSASNTDDVVSAVKVLAYTGSNYAIRSGGHSPLINWASIDGGVLLSMSNLTDIAYDAGSNTVRTGFGLRWADVYSYVEGFGRLVVGGRVADVGQGLTLGGGLSHLSNAYGFSGDNVVGFEVVLSNAKVVNATSDSNPDLFWALKGGSNNFGIVTHMTLKTYPIEQVWGGTIIYNSSYSDRYMSAIASYQAVGQLDTKSAIITYLVPADNEIILTLVYLSPTTRPSCFQPFYDIPATMDGTQLWQNFTSLIGGPLNTGLSRWTWGTTTIYLDEQTYVDVANIAAQASSPLSNISAGTLVIFPQPISVTMVEAAKLTGGNPLGLRSRSQLWFSINIGWALSSDDQTAYSILQRILEKVSALTQSRGLLDPFTFLNDAYSSQPVFMNYGAANLARLQDVATRYDPSRMFQKQVPGGFKVF